MKDRYLILSLLLLLPNLAFFLLTVLPLRREAAAQGEILRELQSRNRQLQQELKQQEVLLSVYREAERYRHRIPPPGSIVAMIRRVTDQARRLDLEVPSVKYEPSEVKGGELTKVTVQMEVEGSYAGIRRFLYEVEGLQEPLSIEKLNLTSQAKDKGMDRIALRLQMAVFFRAEGGTVPKEQPVSKPERKEGAHAG